MVVTTFPNFLRLPYIFLYYKWNALKIHFYMDCVPIISPFPNFPDRLIFLVQCTKNYILGELYLYGIPSASKVSSIFFPTYTHAARCLTNNIEIEFCPYNEIFSTVGPFYITLLHQCLLLYIVQVIIIVVLHCYK